MYTRNDYISIGNKHKLRLLSSHVPTDQNVPVRWLCEQTGEELLMSLRQIKRSTRGCVCDHRPNAASYEEYVSVAAMRGVEFLEDRAPANSHVPVRWLGSNGQEVRASLRQMKHKYTKQLQERLHGKRAEEGYKRDRGA